MSNRRIQTQVQRQPIDQKMTLTDMCVVIYLCIVCLIVCCMYMFLSEVPELQYIYQVR